MNDYSQEIDRAIERIRAHLAAHHTGARSLAMNYSQEDLISVKTSVLCEVGRALERLRITNPMNGDGSNSMLNRCLTEIIHLDHEGIVENAILDEREAMAKKAESDHFQLERENRLGHQRGSEGDCYA